jgi:hypothetical protein
LRSAAVDGQVGAAAVARGNQFLDCGIDRRIFAADAGTGDEAEQREGRQVGRKRAGARAGDVDGERDEEQSLATKEIGKPAEQHGTQHGAGEICAGGKPDLGVGQAQRRAGLECTRNGAGKRHFEAVEHPRDPERYDHQRMKPRPRQPIEPRRID